ncbi:MAG: arylamine N-acetyltransferase, partial [Verrucomicrobiota bacterium]
MEDDGSQLTARYLSSLGLEKAKVSLEYVSELQRAHLRKFSFNNIGVLLGRDLNLDLDPLFDRIVTKGQGGYCFEHNKLFMEVLQGLGAKVSMMMGKVTREVSSESPRAHRFTVLKVSGDERTYLVDVGYGPLCPRQPVPIVFGEEIEVRGGFYRFERNEYGETVF